MLTGENIAAATEETIHIPFYRTTPDGAARPPRMVPYTDSDMD